MAKSTIPFSHNCFTVALRGAPVPGIKLASAQQGLPARLSVGHRYLMVDNLVPAQISNGVVMMAAIRHVNTGGGRSIRTLGQPEQSRPTTSLLYVNCTIPGKKSAVTVDGFPVQLYTGVNGGRVIERFEQEFLIELSEGQALTVFFEDGSVRSWRRQGEILDERYFTTPEAVLAARIAQAKSVLASAGDGPRAQDFVKAVLLGMVGLLRFTTRFDAKGIGQGLRLQLLREFFLELPEHLWPVIARALFSALTVVDRPLLAMLDSGEPEQVSATVVNIADRRAEVEVLSPEDREARRQANIARDEAARAAKAARQAVFKAKRKPIVQPPKQEGKKDKKNKRQRQEAA